MNPSIWPWVMFSKVAPISTLFQFGLMVCNISCQFHKLLLLKSAKHFHICWFASQESQHIKNTFTSIQVYSIEKVDSFSAEFWKECQVKKFYVRNSKKSFFETINRFAIFAHTGEHWRVSYRYCRAYSINLKLGVCNFPPRAFNVTANDCVYRWLSINFTANDMQMESGFLINLSFTIELYIYFSVKQS